MQVESRKENSRAALSNLAKAVIGAAYEVSNELGAGFLEKVYERALHQELSLRDIEAKAQANCPVHYKGVEVGYYLADLLVADNLIVEVKTVKELGNLHLAQCLNYLKATGLHLALLLNFQHPKVEWRLVFREF